MLTEAGLPPHSRVLDPWNGSGTTIEAALSLGLDGVGYDLNPVMVVVSKARTLSERTRPSLVPLAREMLTQVNKLPQTFIAEDPLRIWLHPAAASTFRRLENCVIRHLVSDQIRAPLGCDGAANLSDLAAFYYTALFRTLRGHLGAFLSTNPTWVKCPKESDRIRISESKLASDFLETVEQMAESLRDCLAVHSSSRTTIAVASSEALPLAAGSVDCVLASPPYCTRIDYAVATRPELALLGFGAGQAHSFRELRESLTGSTTVPPTVRLPISNWGRTCALFLDSVKQHYSKASKTYYYKQHVQYFNSIYRSLAEIRRVVKPGGLCTLVVQDSHYKEVHNPLPEIFIQMATTLGLEPMGQSDFATNRVFARLNPHARKYRSHVQAVESVLIFRR